MNQKKIKAITIEYAHGYSFGKIGSADILYKRHSLDKSWQLEECNENPDLIIYCCCKPSYLKYQDILRIRWKWGFTPFLLLITGEVYPYNLLSTDYNISFRPDSKNNLHLGIIPREPLYFKQFLSGKVPRTMEEYRKYPKHRFCNFIYSRPVKLRNQFCKLLLKYKHIDCLGIVMNNTDELRIMERKMVGIKQNQEIKMEIQKQYKFSIAFENQRSPGYLTEKIWHAFISGTIPIYWGCPEVNDFFNPATFVNCHDYASFSDVIEKIKEIDNDSKLYESYRNVPIILPNSKFHNYSEAKVSKKMNHIMNLIVQKREKYENYPMGRLQTVAHWSWFFLINARYPFIMLIKIIIKTIKSKLGIHQNTFMMK